MCAPLFPILVEHQDDLDLDEAIRQGGGPINRVSPALQTHRIGTTLPVFFRTYQGDRYTWTESDDDDDEDDNHYDDEHDTNNDPEADITATTTTEIAIPLSTTSTATTTTAIAKIATPTSKMKTLMGNPLRIVRLTIFDLILAFSAYWHCAGSPSRT
ncbi:uncharacterized protein BP01DRAFT_381009 [Aspergillus saccharolyticus JOP 1030-1]|uniref:Uncharacterized protein n=1 Tax=Aspergillus saccharolyticus JOP 1030-1 TaxID=1450539 RepID=A0A319A4V9_9EURO|nr:hypothetical protein BP01DRAFT_381009 [Aspergillus saccharolyticus JOP 1030-1]PYH47168.1 hypothetical protein BP01DRAFT_381009 [Aspergillus saccharolyticus JOP 1030-1]